MTDDGRPSVSLGCCAQLRIRRRVGCPAGSLSSSPIYQNHASEGCLGGKFPGSRIGATRWPRRGDGPRGAARVAPRAQHL